MASKCDITSFTELQTLSRSELRDLPSNRLAEISLNVLENCNNVEKVFKFWTREILNVHNLADFDSKFLHQIFNAFVDYTIQSIPNTLSCITEECFQLISSNLQEWQNVLEISKVNPKLYCIAIFVTIITCALRVLASYYSFMKNSKATTPLNPHFSTGLTTIMGSSQHLQRTILSIILQNPTYILCSSTSDIHAVVNVMDSLIMIGKIVPVLDVRLTAEIWKIISKISTDNAPFITSSVADKKFLWAGRPIQFLCEEIRKSLHDIYETSNASLEIVERILKISSFYLKLLIKFASDFSHQHFVDNDEVLKTMIFLLSPPESVRSSEVGTLIKQYLTIGFISLISLVYKNREFAKLLCQENIESYNHFKTFFRLTSEVLKLFISEKDTTSINLYLTSDDNLIEKIFKGFTKYPSVLLEKMNYESFVTTVSALILSLCNTPDLVARVEKCLIRGVLQNSLMLANVCMDIWLTLSRFIDGESRYKYFSFWFKRYSEFPLLSIEPCTIYVKNLVRNLYNILPSSYKNRFWQDVTDLKSIMMVLLILGCDKIPDQNKCGELKLRLSNKVISLSYNFSSKISVDEYLTLVQNFQILSMSSLSSECDGYEKLIALFMNLLKISINKKQTVLHISFINFITKHIRKFSKIQLTNLTRLLKQYMVYFNSTTFKLCVLIFLSEMIKFDQSEPLLSLSKSVQTDSNILVSSIARALFDVHRDSASRVWDGSDVQNYLREQLKFEFSHRCSKDISCLEQNPAKKLKTDIDFRNTLKQILCDVNTFANMYKDVKFSTSDLAVINEIKDVFVRITNK